MNKEFENIQDILQESDHAELLEEVDEAFLKARRVLLLVELNAETGSNYRFYQNGFKQYYEIDGFLRLMNEVILDCQEPLGDIGDTD